MNESNGRKILEAHLPGIFNYCSYSYTLFFLALVILTHNLMSLLANALLQSIRQNIPKIQRGFTNQLIHIASHGMAGESFSACLQIMQLGGTRSLQTMRKWYGLDVGMSWKAQDHGKTRSPSDYRFTTHFVINYRASWKSVAKLIILTL